MSAVVLRQAAAGLARSIVCDLGIIFFVRVMCDLASSALALSSNVEENSTRSVLNTTVELWLAGAIASPPDMCQLTAARRRRPTSRPPAWAVFEEDGGAPDSAPLHQAPSGAALAGVRVAAVSSPAPSHELGCELC
eukprot:CAMPEP_0179476846 /NCGR_PEP_ID=MMETSP0799-20121207/55790_1 /TAXON_ID=46947 /ORGANISM="Geminigera cryophila, Strain CCMP2564" /LENGTH=135 /DNA_ID=CAMNT_0021287293 /DNA_START=171 /DNA_END=581 /DNA_ORIENTATION=+